MARSRRGGLSRTMRYEVVIGLEVHSQLLTRSKMFCSCRAAYQDAKPNTFVCPVCMGMPGVLPVINRRSVELVIRTGLALGCTISGMTKFDRKNYPYPDLMKGYQISQYDEPIATDGRLTIQTDGGAKEVGITRVHLEEDVAKLFHRTDETGEPYSLLDINRAGVSLMEIVSEPDMRSPEEARSYLVHLHSILRFIDVSTANMEEGSFRCDANISLRPRGATDLGSKVEIKNMNSFRAVYRALQFESERQSLALDGGERIVQETRGWVEEPGVTVSQRSKEYASDYRYFPEPDLPPLVISPELVRQVRESLPELPEARKIRFIEQFGLSEYDAEQMTSTRARADFFERIMRLSPASGDGRNELAKTVSNWMLGEWLPVVDLAEDEREERGVQPEHYLELLDLIEEGTLSTTMARKVSREMMESATSPRQIARESGMVQISDSDAILSAVEEAVQGNPDPVSDYLNGKETAARFLVGQVMKATRGKANPQLVSTLVKEKLESLR